MNLYIDCDCEFDSYRGRLISMALVADDDAEFYEVLVNGAAGAHDPWVDQHVIPVLRKEPVGLIAFQLLLESYLAQFKDITVVADYPTDLQHFCYVLENGPGTRIATPPLTMKIDRRLHSEGSAVPHNALEDARAIKRLATGK